MFGALAGMALLATCRTMTPSGPDVAFSDQRVEYGAVAVGRVVSEGPGWLVIHSEVNGAPGPVLGWVAVKPGLNRNVRVKIGSAGLTPYLWAMLHVDAGNTGSYEFPGPDAPVAVDGQVVMRRFKLSQGGGMGGGY